MPYLKTSACMILLAAVAACDTSETPFTPRAESPQFIVNSQPTGASYGSVGALYYDFNGNRRIEGDELVCTGSLISATVFLTAAHCVEFLPSGAQVYVSFDDTAFPRPSQTIAATDFAWDPGYAHDSGDYHDIGVVLLPANATRGMKPFHLPKAGARTRLPLDREFGLRHFSTPRHSRSARFHSCALPRLPVRRTTVRFRQTQERAEI